MKEYEKQPNAKAYEEALEEAVTEFDKKIITLINKADNTNAEVIRQAK